MSTGKIIGITGSVIMASGLDKAGINHRVDVGADCLAGEIIAISSDKVKIQVYEPTDGLRIGEPVSDLGKAFSVCLGPGLLGSVFDGIQRRLHHLKEEEGDFIGKGVKGGFESATRKWEAKVLVKKGDKLTQGDLIATVLETELIEHRIYVPPGMNGVVEKVASGPYTLKDTICYLEGGGKIKLSQWWPCRVERPHRGKKSSSTPHITGQRVLDCFFPLALGGIAVMPGGFGTGKTILEHALARFIDADVVVYVGCGERGNEMSELLQNFAGIVDPDTLRPLLERTIMVVNTSNMPVAAREASIYTGVTMAEYYRDMGYKVVLLADSISRWAEALREISSRLEEMPGEEGYPSYMASRLSQFYERAGMVKCLGGSVGSLSFVVAVSPPGGDLSEPVTQASLRVTGCFWALDPKLAAGRHYPAVNWRESFSLYRKQLSEAWVALGCEGWGEKVAKLDDILGSEESVRDIAQLVGYDSLQDKEKLLLAIGRAVREAFLRQDYYHPVDATSSPAKSAMMIERLLNSFDEAMRLLEAGDEEYEDPSDLLDRKALYALRFTSFAGSGEDGYG